MRIENEKSRVARAGGENVGVRIEAVGRGRIQSHLVRKIYLCQDFRRVLFYGIM